MMISEHDDGVGVTVDFIDAQREREGEGWTSVFQ